MVMTNSPIVTNMMKKKTTQGRKKIEIKKIEEVNKRQVTFSKRRVGLFKKASELCVLTGAEIAIIVLSPGGRVFAFGHPNTNFSIDRYVTGDDNSEDSHAVNTQKALPPMQKFNQHYVKVSKELEEEKRRREKIQEGKTVNNVGGIWYNEPVDGLGLEELEQYLASLEELKKKVLMRADELMMIKSSSLSNNIFELGLDDFENNHFQNVEFGTTTNAMVPVGFDFGHGHGQV